MTHRTWKPDDFGAYLESEYPLHNEGSAQASVEETQERNTRLAVFPHAVLLQVSYPEMDFANRWCWQQFGPSDGQCLESYSNYPACTRSEKHEHEGSWASRWLAKTDCDFGYNEWYFSNQADRDRFVDYLPQLNWGDKLPTTPQ